MKLYKYLKWVLWDKRKRRNNFVAGSRFTLVGYTKEQLETMVAPNKEKE